MNQRTLGLRTPVVFRRHFDFAHAVALDPNLVAFASHRFSSCPRELEWKRIVCFLAVLRCQLRSSGGGTDNRKRRGKTVCMTGPACFAGMDSQDRLKV